MSTPDTAVEAAPLRSLADVQGWWHGHDNGDDLRCRVCQSQMTEVAPTFNMSNGYIDMQCLASCDNCRVQFKIGRSRWIGHLVDFQPRRAGVDRD